jgi:hypothetical protein
MHPNEPNRTESEIENMPSPQGFERRLTFKSSKSSSKDCMRNEQKKCGNGEWLFNT